MQQYSANIQVMLTAVRKASRGLARDFGEVEKLQVSKKGPKNFVTSADMKAEKIIISELQKARPDYPILSEEAGLVKGTDEEYCWIIDPLDGTTNFLHGFPFFCTTIALQKKLPNGKKEIIAGVIDAPILKETFWAEKGQGAWFESGDISGSVRLRVGARTKLIDCMLGIGSFSTDIRNPDSLTPEVRATRCMGSTVLGMAYLAAGRYDCFMHVGCYPWDIAAGILLVKEAGGYVSDIHGQEKMFENRSVVAANHDLHGLVLKKISK